MQDPSMGQPRPYIDDEIYDPNGDQPHGVREEQAIELRIELPNNAGGQPQWSWTVHQSARGSPNGIGSTSAFTTDGEAPMAVPST